MATYLVRPATVSVVLADRKRATLAGLGPMGRRIVMPDGSELPDFVVQDAVISATTADGKVVSIEPVQTSVVVSDQTSQLP